MVVLVQWNSSHVFLSGRVLMVLAMADAAVAMVLTFAFGFAFSDISVCTCEYKLARLLMQHEGCIHLVT